MANRVWFVGPEDLREIGIADWSGVGITGPTITDNIWYKGNGWSIPQVNFTSLQLTWLDTQADFLINAPDYGQTRPNQADSTTGIPPDQQPATRLWVEQQIAILDSLPTIGGITYDGSGNVLTDNEGNSYTYNSDGSIATITNGTVVRTFTYTGDDITAVT
jgi:hypothetical protein